MISDLIQNNRIIVCVGSGGVGKTTASAAIALAGAIIAGKKTLCITIDPARRLKDSLGLKTLGSEIVKVNISDITTYQLKFKTNSNGSLSAVMLDPSLQFDRVLSKYAPSEEIIRKIKESPFFTSAVTTLTGSQEYMGMEMLYEIDEEREYDLIVLDTPPTIHAIDFLDAPKRLENMFDNEMFKLFVLTTKTLGKVGIQFLKWHSFILKALSKIIGKKTFMDVLEFIFSFNEMYDGFKKRAVHVKSALRGKDVSFIILTSPDLVSIEDALFFYKRLRVEGLNCGSFMINKVKNNQSGRIFNDSDIEKLFRESPVSREHSPELTRRLAKHTEWALNYYNKLASADEKNINTLYSKVDPNVSIVQVPLFHDDIHDINGLFRFMQEIRRVKPTEYI